MSCCASMPVSATAGFTKGAGIYRHVWLIKTDAVHLGRWESTVRPALSGNFATLDLATVVENEAISARERQSQLEDSSMPTERRWPPPKRPAIVAARWRRRVHAYRESGQSAPMVRRFAQPLCRHRDRRDGTANCATANASPLACAPRFDADKGFFLNGKPLKIQGTCNHQDHAGVGAALPDRLQAFRLSVLREMGCNAVRTSHNMPTPGMGRRPATAWA